MQEPKENRDKRQCRSCLSVGNELLDIFQEGYRDILSILSGLQVTIQDCLPNYICMDCIAVLKKFIDFRENCKRSYDFLFKLQHGDIKGFDKVSESTIRNRTPIKLEGNDAQSENPQIEYENDLIEIKHQFVESNLSNCINNDYTEENQPKNEWNNFTIVKNVSISDEHSGLEVQNDSISIVCGSSEIESVSEHLKTPVKKKRQRIGAIAQDKAETKRKPKGGVVKIIKKKISHMDNVDPLKIEKIRLSMEEQKSELVKKSQSEDYLNAPYKCENCFKYFLYEDNYNDHLRTRHDESIGPHLCTLCRSRFKAKGTLTSHAYKHSVIFRCLACSVTYKKLISAEEHYKVVHEKIPPTLVCHLCGKISKSSHAQSRHMKLTHSENALVRIQCTKCPAAFFEKNHYKAHMRYHSDIKPFKCDICGNAYHFKDTMLKHRLMHSDEKNFYCGMCDLSYRCQRFLDKHLKDSPKHGGKKQEFNCGICRTSFTVQSEMFKHKEREHGIVFKPKKRPEERTHQCDTCGKAFSTNVTLKSHLRTHTGERPFSCETCGRAFTQRSAMQTHVKLVHLNMKWSELVKKKK